MSDAESLVISSFMQTYSFKCPPPPITTPQIPKKATKTSLTLLHVIFLLNNSPLFSDVPLEVIREIIEFISLKSIYTGPRKEDFRILDQSSQITVDFGSDEKIVTFKMKDAMSRKRHRFTALMSLPMPQRCIVEYEIVLYGLPMPAVLLSVMCGAVLQEQSGKFQWVESPLGFLTRTLCSNSLMNASGSRHIKVRQVLWENGYELYEMYPEEDIWCAPLYTRRFSNGLSSDMRNVILDVRVREHVTHLYARLSNLTVKEHKWKAPETLA